jgi:hypothetical protein
MRVGDDVIRVRPDLGGIRSTAVIWDDGRQENALRHAASSFDCDAVGCFVDVLSGSHEWEERRPLLGLDEPFFGPDAGALFSRGSFRVFRCLSDDEACVVVSSAYTDFSPASVRIAVIPLPRPCRSSAPVLPQPVRSAGGGGGPDRAAVAASTQPARQEWYGRRPAAGATKAPPPPGIGRCALRAHDQICRRMRCPRCGSAGRMGWNIVRMCRSRQSNNHAA